MKHSQNNRRYWAAGLAAFCVVAAALILFFLLFQFHQILRFMGLVNWILRPIYYGLILAFLLLPIHRRFYAALCSMAPESRLAVRRYRSLLNGFAILFSILLAFLLFYLLLAMVLPQVYLSIVGLVRAFPGYVDNLQKLLMNFLENNPDIQPIVLNYYSSLSLSVEQWLRTSVLANLESAEGAAGLLKNSILPNLTGVVSNVYAGILALLLLLKDLLIGIVVSVYLLARKDVFAAQSKKIMYSLLPPHPADLVVEEVRNIYKILSGFINGKLLDSLIIGIICWAGCVLLRFPYPVLLATIVGVTNVIPFFGPFIGAIPCTLLILLVSPLQSLYFVLFILLLQQFDGNILGPKILGESTGLASFWVLFSILLFGGLFGFPGMVLGVPVFAVLYSIASRLVRHSLRGRNLPEETTFYLGPTGRLSGWRREAEGQTDLWDGKKP